MLKYILINLATIFFILGFSYDIKAQQIVNTKAFYRNDTLLITYDLTGNQKLDSLNLSISSFTSKKKYDLKFSGDIDTIISPGIGKKIFAKINRDSFPDDGESLRIQLIGWTKSLPVKRKNRLHLPKIDLSKIPVNPRFTFSTSAGLIFRSSDYSEKSSMSNFILNYNPTNNFQIGIGAGYFRFIDSIKTYSTYPIFINVALKFSNPAFIFMRLGFCPKNMGPAVTLGIGYKIISYGPFGIDVSAQLHRFDGFRTINAFSLNAGLSIDFSSRKNFKKDFNYRFKRSFLMYPEFGINFYNKASPSVSGDISYIVSPFYTQGIGISYEIIHYNFNFPVELEYYSSYYKRYVKYIAGIAPVELNINIIPLYLCGRLYFSRAKYRNYIFWKYGYTIYSKLEKGELKNGFVADLGMGLRIPVKKDIGLNLIFGAKYFNNKGNYEGVTNDIFGTFYIKTGFVF
jgi:hypothetical protein